MSHPYIFTLEDRDGLYLERGSDIAVLLYVDTEQELILPKEVLEKLTDEDYGEYGVDKYLFEVTYFIGPYDHVDVIEGWLTVKQVTFSFGLDRPMKVKMAKEIEKKLEKASYVPVEKW